MKKRNHRDHKKKLPEEQKETKEEHPVSEEPPDSEDERSFSTWLRSHDGMETLKLFVIGNTIVIMSLTMLPQLKDFFDNIFNLYKDFFPD